MICKNRLSAFIKLGLLLNEQLGSENAEFIEILTRASQENPWFTENSIRFALSGVVEDLSEKNLNDWVSRYTTVSCESALRLRSGLEGSTTPKTIAVIMAGNLPLVGFRDFLAVLVSGHNILCKLSSKDSVLLKYLAKKLIEIEPDFSERICFENHITKGFDAVIATGGYHAVEHFHECFSKYPHIIRGHRNSCAVLDGTENTEDLNGLFEDMFRYFGLGCRNVTKLFVPEGYNFEQLVTVGARHTSTSLSNLASPLQSSLKQHHLYQSNYKYQTVVLGLSARQMIDAGTFILIENSGLTPPISVVYYEYYSDLADVRNILDAQKNQIQCIVSRADTPFGQAQKPTLLDYADGVDTMEFLECRV